MLTAADFWRFVLARHAAYLAGTRFTGDHYTNVFRALDPGTQLIHPATAGFAPEDALYAVSAYRQVNWRPTMEAFGSFPQRADHERWIAFLTARRAAKVKTATHRHQTNSVPEMTRALDVVRAAAVPPTAAELVRLLDSVPRFGPFFVNQIAADALELALVPYDPRALAVGPGARYALEMLAGRLALAQYGDFSGGSSVGRSLRVSSRPKNERYIGLIGELLVGAPLPLTAIDAEHALCEWLRFELNGGFPGYGLV